jgi:hypothetical protein
VDLEPRAGTELAHDLEALHHRHRDKYH